MFGPTARKSPSANGSCTPQSYTSDREPAGHVIALPMPHLGRSGPAPPWPSCAGAKLSTVRVLDTNMAKNVWGPPSDSDLKTSGAEIAVRRIKGHDGLDGDLRSLGEDLASRQRSTIASESPSSTTSVRRRTIGRSRPLPKAQQPASYNACVGRKSSSGSSTRNGNGSTAESSVEARTRKGLSACDEGGPAPRRVPPHPPPPHRPLYHRQRHDPSPCSRQLRRGLRRGRGKADKTLARRSIELPRVMSQTSRSTPRTQGGVHRRITSNRHRQGCPPGSWIVDSRPQQQNSPPPDPTHPHKGGKGKRRPPFFTPNKRGIAKFSSHSPPSPVN